MLLTAAAALSGCTIDPFHLDVAGAGASAGDAGMDASTPTLDGGRADGSNRGTGSTPGDGDGDGDDDAGLSECVFEPERCDGADNDCDGKTDEDFDLDADPQNCGACGTTCQRSNTLGLCEAGACRFECDPAFIDLDGDDSNGCEYGCILTNGGDELCDFADNDCDGEVDEGFDLDTDELNCGGCGKMCPNANGTPVCAAGACTYPVCSDGFADLLPNVPGCEYECPTFPTVAQESCDSVDQDCDGRVDEAAIEIGTPCHLEAVDANPGLDYVGAPRDTGACVSGTTSCMGGNLVCTGSVGPTDEFCDGVDNDCDGTVDNGFNKLTNPNTCGASCIKCAFDNAVPICDAGTCKIGTCFPGFTDDPNTVGTDCDYKCTKTGAEVCDNRDNDCDGLVDNDIDPTFLPAAICSPFLNGVCLLDGDGSPGETLLDVGPACIDGSVVCDIDSGTFPGYENDGAGQEISCDDLDNDCDGQIDEAYPLKGTDCDNGLLGVCRSSGELDCNGSNDGLVCDDSGYPGQSPGTEVCDARDNDCDGLVDEPKASPGSNASYVVDAMVQVTPSVGSPYFIYGYEASRPGATDSLEGSSESRACSKAGALPWRRVDWAEAKQACEDAGHRLCSAAEWLLSCGGDAGNSYPYGSVYEGQTCNGGDYDTNGSTAPVDNTMLPAGSMSSCVSPAGALDMSGNLHEWTLTQVSTSPVAYRVKGGGFTTPSDGLRCDNDFIAFEPDEVFDTLGFRCCSDVAP